MSNPNEPAISSRPPALSNATADVLRLGAMVAVLIIHATGRWEAAFRREHSYFSEDFLAVLLNQLARFSVPLFVLLSGYGLARKYASLWAPAPGGAETERVDTLRSSGGLGDFFRRRFAKIGVPFLVWTVGLLALGGRFHCGGADGVPAFLEKNVLANLTTLAPYLYRQGADYHFYFFIIILQMYVLFPLLLRLTLALGPRGRGLLLIGLLLWQLFWTYPSVLLFQYLDWPRPSFPTAFFIYWWFYFYAGIFIALHGAREYGRGARFLVLSSSALFFALMLAEYLTRSYVDAEPGYYNHFSRWTVVAYSLAVTGILMVYDRRIADYFDDREVWARRLKIGVALTFAVYLFHTWILRLIQWTFLGYELFVTIVVLSVASFAAAYLLHKIVRWTWLRLVLGLP